MKAKEVVKSLFAGVLLFVGIVIVLGIISNKVNKDDGDSISYEQYNDNSLSHQILAKKYFADDVIKYNLKDEKSYDEISYTSEYNYSKECYEVSITYRAKNSFGGYVRSIMGGDVIFTNSGEVKFDNITKDGQPVKQK